LAHDLGQRLGSGAYLAALVRLSSGRFSLEEAVSLQRLEEAFQHGQEEIYLLPVDEALLEWPAMIVSDDEARRIAQGQAIQGDLPESSGDGASLCRAYSIDGLFLAIMAFHPDTGWWHPQKVFSAQ
jgi:tRNA pseudouridine55 synthase